MLEWSDFWEIYGHLRSHIWNLELLYFFLYCWSKHSRSIMRQGGRVIMSNSTGSSIFSFLRSIARYNARSSVFKMRWRRPHAVHQKYTHIGAASTRYVLPRLPIGIWTEPVTAANGLLLDPYFCLGILQFIERLEPMVERQLFLTGDVGAFTLCPNSM